jgi:hypothetical protein
MPLTREFNQTVKARAEVDVKFRVALLEEAIELLIAGDVETGKVLLRDYINATIGFKRLGVITRKSSKSLMRMLSPDGNPRADNMFCVIASLQKQEGTRLSVRAQAS